MKSLKLLCNEFGKMEEGELYVVQDHDIIGLDLYSNCFHFVEAHSLNTIKVALRVNNDYSPPDTLLFWSIEEEDQDA